MKFFNLKSCFLSFSFLFLFSITSAQSVNQSPYCPVLSVNITMGSRDSKTFGQVTELQKFFKSYYGLSDSQLLISGTYGAVSRKFVLFFQKNNGIVPTGVVGPATRAKIQSLCVEEDTDQNEFANPVTNTATSTTISCRITANPNSIKVGEKSLISWNAINSTSGIITGIGDITTSNGSASVSPTQTTTYLASFTNPTTQGSATCSTSINVTASSTDTTCTLDGTKMGNGQALNFYSAKIFYNPDSCSKNTSPRLCSSGVLGGDTKYQYSTCTTVTSPATTTSTTTNSVI